LREAVLDIFYCDHYDFPLTPGHKFPLAKYRLLREELENDARFALQAAAPAEPAPVLKIHTPAYVNEFLTGTLPGSALRRIGLPWSPELVQRTLASVGATLRATESALACGFGGTLAGGTHHAFRNEGAGFCVFNDLAIAIECARENASIRRAAVIDLDVHQGDGTAAIFAGDPEVFTFSLHGARNFPFRKQRSALDIELPDRTGDDAYLAVLKTGLDRVWDFTPDLVLFQSGVDGLSTDRLGRLSLSPEGLRCRDQLVIGQAHAWGVPLVITLGGGYSDPIQNTVYAHANTFRTAANIFCH
jgi:acetoin utilization deacetylase AcuC-like enzyme